MTCPICGGTIIGDGYTIVHHCENACDTERLRTAEPDADVILCCADCSCEVMMQPCEACPNQPFK